jgi:hypothetical protein
VLAFSVMPLQVEMSTALLVVVAIIKNINANGRLLWSLD